MNYLITESQMQVILENSVKERITENMKELNDFAKRVIEDVSIHNKLNFKFLLTWGASIGGMIGPLTEWVAGNIPDLSQQEVSLLVLGAVSQFYYDNERKIKSLYKRIKELNLESEFEIVRLKADELKNTFVEFLKSIGITTSNLINTMSYAFLIPILEDLYHLSLGADNTQALISLIGKRLLASGAMLITGATLTNLIRKLAKKFQEKN